MDELKPGRVVANGIGFATLEIGDGPLVLCLHGFPDTAETFKFQMAALAEAGYRAVAPNMRGYPPTEIPSGGPFQSAILGLDAIALIEALGYRSAAIFGHDWGAMAAYGAAIAAPDVARCIVTAALPYGVQVMNAYVTNYDQLKRSWYMFFFQHPIAEAALEEGDLAMIERLWRDWSPGWDVPVKELERVKRAFRVPGAVAAALGYYRETLDARLQRPELAWLQSKLYVEPVPVPCLALHGTRDGCVGAELLGGMEAFFPNGLEVELVKGAGHFLHLERPHVVNGRIVSFFREVQNRGGGWGERK